MNMHIYVVVHLYLTLLAVISNYYALCAGILLVIVATCTRFLFFFGSAALFCVVVLCVVDNTSL